MFLLGLKRCKKMLVSILILTLTTSFVYAANDGYIAEETDAISIVNFNSVNAIIGYRGIPSQSHTRDGNRYSMRWNDHTNNSYVRVALDASVPRDLSDYNRLRMWIYSEKATNATIKCLFYSPPAADGSIQYWHKDFIVDWEGFKAVSINFSTMSSVRSPDWSNIYQFDMYANSGWGLVGDPETDLYIASVEVVKDSTTNSLAMNYSDEVIEQTMEALEDSVGLYAGGQNAATSQGAVPIGYTIGWKESAVTVPVCVFEQHLGATVKTEGESYSVKIGSNTLSGTLGSQQCMLNDTQTTLDSVPYTEEGMLYLPGESAAKLLGLATYTDGKFLLMGTETAAQAVRRKGHLGVNYALEIASYLSYHTEEAVEYTEEQYQEVLANWKRHLVGDETINDISDENIAYKVRNYETNADTALRNFVTDAASDVLFSDLTITTTSEMSSAYTRIKNMAFAYATYGTKYYQDPQIKEKVRYGLEWMYQRYYGINEINGTGWKPSGMNNWYDWEIGSPRSIIQTLIVMEEAFTPEEITKYLSYYDMRMPRPKASTVGSNLGEITLNVFGSGVLQRNTEKVRIAEQYFEQLYFFVDDNQRSIEWYLDAERTKYTPIKANGFFTDGSYIYHTLHAQNGTYGVNHYEVLCDIEAIMGGTAFEIDSPVRDNFPIMFFNNLNSIIFGTAMYRAFLGRSESPTTVTAGVLTLARAVEWADRFDPEICREIYSVVKGAYQTNPVNSFYTSLSFDGISKFNEMLEDESIEPADDRYMNKVYYNLDKVVHEQGDWAMAVSMSSSRVFNYESINDTNVEGWYLGDGRTEYLIKGSSDGASMQYWNKIDNYRLPGTTVDTQERERVSVDQGNEYLSSKDFVGGVSLGGRYGVAAMDLESYHADEPIGSASSHGQPNPVHKNDLTALKGYFMFDDSVVCLGAEVNAKDNNDAEVLTIVDNRLSKVTKYISEYTGSEEYQIQEAVSSETPEPENTAENTIDDSMSTKWAAEDGAYIVWDLGEVKNCGFIALSFQRGTERTQQFELHLSTDGSNWTQVFNGSSSGTQDVMECFDLGSQEARYVKFTNRGNSVANSTWVSLCDCKIYAPNEDGSIGVEVPDAYGADEFIADGSVVNLLGDDYDLSNITWANIGGECGYYFPKENSSNLGALKARWTKGTDSFFELWFSHGVNPTSSSYAYVLLPGKDAAYTEEYASQQAISVLSNTQNVQAVYNKKLGITGIIFRKAGSFGKITVDQPCIVMYQETEDSFDIAVSDPTQKLKQITLSIQGEMSVETADDCAQISSGDGMTYIGIDAADSVGRTFENNFKKNK